MRYKPPNDNDEPFTQTSYTGDLTLDPMVAHQRYKYEMENKPGLIDQNYMKRNKDLVISINKFMPLGYYNRPHTLKLIGRRFSNIIGERDAGLDDNAEETTLCILKDIAMSRGQQGFAAKLEVTEHKVWEDITKRNEKRPLFGGFLRKHNEETEQTVMLQ